MKDLTPFGRAMGRLRFLEWFSRDESRFSLPIDVSISGSDSCWTWGAINSFIWGFGHWE